jgi:ATP-dependent Lon protease
VPKDGPSAGVTMVTALVSLVTERRVRPDTAMTGEVTLTGQVLPIGGLKEKALAAQRAGIERVIAPKLNEADLDEFPEHLTRGIEFIFVDEVERVLEEALEAAAPPARPTELPRSRRRSGRASRCAPAAARGRLS